MSTILELWDIHEHNARIINMIDKNSRFLFFRHRQLSFQIVWTLFLLTQ